MLDEILSDLKSSIGKAHEALKRDLGKVRTGRAHAGMLDSVRVDYYGVMTPIGQMATVNVPEPRLLTVKPWDKSAVKLVEKAIRDADLGLNPQVDGDLIRLPIPPLTEERRREMVKVARSKGEDAKVSVRNTRRHAKDALDKLQKDGDAGEDDVHRAERELDETTSKYVANIDELLKHKESELLEV